MGNYGIKILKPNHTSGVTVETATPKDLVILSTVESHKVANIYTDNITHTNTLGYISYFESFDVNADGSYSPRRKVLTTTTIPASNNITQYYEGTV